jgi:hypothetical protein
MGPFGSKLLELPKWTLAGATIWPRAGFKCEYCDTTLVKDHGTYRWGTRYDHILPQSKYIFLFTEPSTATWLRFTAAEYRNIALACVFCNLAKSSWDAGSGILDSNAVDISLDQRKVVIERVRERVGHIGRREWKLLLSEFDEFHEILSGAEVNKIDGADIK